MRAPASRFAFTVLLGAIPCMACGDGPAGPRELNPADTAQRLGTLVSSGPGPIWDDRLTWLPGSGLLAYTTHDSRGCAVTALDVTTGAVRIIDDHCYWMYSHLSPYLRRVVAAPDGQSLYYTVGVGSSSAPLWVLRVARLADSGVTTLRSPVGIAALAVSPDGRALAYIAPAEEEGARNTLIVRDLGSGAETPHVVFPAEELAYVISFSPDGADVLYETTALPSLERAIHRRSLRNGEDLVVLSRSPSPALVHWGTAGIQALMESSTSDGTQYAIVSIPSGETVVEVGRIDRDPAEPYRQFARSHAAWSPDGQRVAYWVVSCHEWKELFDCGVARYALFVADTRTGERTRVAFVDRYGPTVFSPDGTRLIYVRSAEGGDMGEFYLIEIP